MLKTRISLNISLNIAQEGEIADMKFFFEKLINTGFLEGSALKSVIGWIQSHLNFGLLTDYLFSLQGRRHPKKTKKKHCFGKTFPNLWTHPPTSGFLWDLETRKMKFGSKKTIFGVIWGVWAYLISENYFWQKTANRNSRNDEIEPLSYILFINTMSVLAQVCEIIEQAVGNLFVQGTFSSMVVSIVIGVSKLRWKSNLPV